MNFSLGLELELRLRLLTAHWNWNKVKLLSNETHIKPMMLLERLALILLIFCTGLTNVLLFIFTECLIHVGLPAILAEETKPGDRDYMINAKNLYKSCMDEGEDRSVHRFLGSFQKLIFLLVLLGR